MHTSQNYEENSPNSKSCGHKNQKTYREAEQRIMIATRVINHTNHDTHHN